MPKGSPELTERRKNEILDACERVYRAQGFYGVTIKEISAETSFTRPAIYNYFESKEEILLGILTREYDVWCDELEKVACLVGKMSRRELAERLALTLRDREILLRIQNMNLFEIEQNSRIERLAEFKRRYQRSVSALAGILRSYRGEADESECTEFCEVFSAFLFGVYPFAFHTEKQLKAMELAGVRREEPSITEMVYRCLIRIIPEKRQGRKK